MTRCANVRDWPRSVADGFQQRGQFIAGVLITTAGGGVEATFQSGPGFRRSIHFRQRLPELVVGVAVGGVGGDGLFEPGDSFVAPADLGVLDPDAIGAERIGGIGGVKLVQLGETLGHGV